MDPKIVEAALAEAIKMTDDQMKTMPEEEDKEKEASPPQQVGAQFSGSIRTLSLFFFSLGR